MLVPSVILLLVSANIGPLVIPNNGRCIAKNEPCARSIRCNSNEALTEASFDCTGSTSGLSWFSLSRLEEEEDWWRMEALVAVTVGMAGRRDMWCLSGALRARAGRTAR
jgi:hypothetical protein